MMSSCQVGGTMCFVNWNLPPNFPLSLVYTAVLLFSERQKSKDGAIVSVVKQENKGIRSKKNNNLEQLFTVSNSVLIACCKESFKQFRLFLNVKFLVSYLSKSLYKSAFLGSIYLKL